MQIDNLSLYVDFAQRLCPRLVHPLSSASKINARIQLDGVPRSICIRDLNLIEQDHLGGPNLDTIFIQPMQSILKPIQGNIIDLHPFLLSSSNREEVSCQCVLIIGELSPQIAHIIEKCSREIERSINYIELPHHKASRPSDLEFLRQTLQGVCISKVETYLSLSFALWSLPYPSVAVVCTANEDLLEYSLNQLGALRVPVVTIAEAIDSEKDIRRISSRSHLSSIDDIGILSCLSSQTTYISHLIENSYRLSLERIDISIKKLSAILDC